jgi:manganese transport protein
LFGLQRTLSQMSQSSEDNYRLTLARIKEPPTTFFARLKFLGPGFILSASIVGSGELIATTTLGARAGFIAFWVIIVSCLVKVAVQLEFGKHAILTGETAMQLLNKLPGKKFGKGKWSLWLIFGLILLKLVQLGGMIGSTAIVLNMLWPGVGVSVWVFVSALSVSVLIYKGYYIIVEKLSLVMIAMFTVMTITSVLALEFTEYSISWQELSSGLTFSLPAGMISVAIGAFGITGVASDEILAYNYWCLEKGYAAYTGPRTDDEAWRRRANGWIKVMQLDAITAMVIYTSVTAAFYLLGAAVLHDRGIIPEGNQLIETVALIYTESLGKGIRVAYLVGAFFVLYSSLFATLAAWTRIYPDIFGQLGWINFNDISRRRKVIAILAWIIPLAWSATFLFINLPVAMILFGGVVGSVMLFLVVFAGIYIKYNVPDVTPPGRFYNLAFWISVVSICFVGAYGIVKLF